MWCIIPLAFMLLIVLLGGLRVVVESLGRFVEYRRDPSGRTATIREQHLNLLLLLSYLILPPVSKHQLQVFDRIQVSGHYYVRGDTSIDAQDQVYYTFRGIVLCFIGLYQLIPMTWAYLLYRNRHELNPAVASHDSRLAMYIRDNNPKLKSLRFLYGEYKCDKWWFEIADMYRRIIFIGVVPLVSPNPATRASFGCILAIMSIVYYREEQPYRVEFTNLVAHVSQVCLYPLPSLHSIYELIVYVLFHVHQFSFRFASSSPSMGR